MDNTLQSQKAFYNENNAFGFANVYQNNNPNYNPAFNTNDPSVLCISGNAYTMKMKGQEFARGGSKNDKTSIRVNLTGSTIHAFNLCCWIVTVLFGSIIIFPLFFICCNWWKRMTFQTVNVEESGYEGLAQIIQHSGAQQIYITVQDNYFDAQKARILLEAVTRSRVQNFSFNNIVTGFDIKGRNYSDFQGYMRQFKQYIKFGDISWGRKFV